MRQSLDKESLLKLTLAVYKVTAIFPVGREGDALSLKIRQVADKILAGKSNVEEMIKLLETAEAKNWINSGNFSILKREYKKITNKAESVNNLNGNRKDKILAVMASNGTARISDLNKLFPGVNRRTVLRDLDELCQTGAMVRNGHGRGVYYVRNDSSTSS